MIKGMKMNKNIRILMQVAGISAALMSGVAYAQERNADETESIGEVLFKIHDVVPEKDADGKVLYCNIGATFFNRTKLNMNNVALTLSWTDDVVGEAIDQEERAEKEYKRTGSTEPRSRYSTAGFTSRKINAPLKLPPLKSMQQVSLRTKVDTDRCFLLLNDMDVVVNNCGTAALNNRVSQQGCNNLFRYISPKSAEYYVEFKEIDLEQQQAMEDAEIDVMQKELNEAFNQTVAAIKNITNENATVDTTQYSAAE